MLSKRTSLALAAFAAMTLSAFSTQVTHSPWQMHPGKGVIDVGVDFRQSKDNNEFYKNAYAKANIPLSDDSGWASAPDPSTINFHVTSKIPAAKKYKAVDYTYFQTVVTVPPGVDITKFLVNFKTMDDGSRIMIFKKAGNEWEPTHTTFVNSGQTASSKDLIQYISEGENRIVITQVDIAPTENNLEYAAIEIESNGKAVVIPATKVIRNASHGDVHITTPDGLVYDFQGTGEFIGMLSSNGNANVQARQEIWDKNPKVSVNTAVALWVDGDLLEFYLKPDFKVYLNGKETNLSQTSKLPKGGSVEEAKKNDFTIMWPDSNFGTRVIIFPGSHIDYGVAKMGGSLTYKGLVGTLDGNPNNDMTFRTTGKVLPPPAAALDLTKFADSWASIGDESLFSVRPLAVPTLNPHTVVKLDPDAKAKAAAKVDAAGITNPIARRNAIYDVALTGADQFIESAKTFQEDTKKLPAEDQTLVAGDVATEEALGGPISAADLMKERAVLTFSGVWDWNYQNTSSLQFNPTQETVRYVYNGTSFDQPYQLADSVKGAAVIEFTLPSGDHAQFEWIDRSTIKGRFWSKGAAKTTKPITETTMRLTEELPIGTFSVADLKKEGAALTYRGVWDWNRKNTSSIQFDPTKETILYVYNGATHNQPYQLTNDASGAAVLEFNLPNGDQAEFEWVDRSTIKGRFWGSKLKCQSLPLAVTSTKRNNLRFRRAINSHRCSTPHKSQQHGNRPLPLSHPTQRKSRLNCQFS